MLDCVSVLQHITVSSGRSDQYSECTMVNRKRKERQREAQREAREMSDMIQRLEVQSGRIKDELDQCRTSEVELKCQMSAMIKTEKSLRTELTGLLHSNDVLQMQLRNITRLRANDRQTITHLERRVAEERRTRVQLEKELEQECEDRMNQEDGARAAQHSTEILMAALAAMQDKNSLLENSLSTETRIKLDLQSTLEIRENVIRCHEKEIEELKCNLAQVLAVMPIDPNDRCEPS